MPRGDGTGPMGTGPMGRGRGGCMPGDRNNAGRGQGGGQRGRMSGMAMNSQDGDNNIAGANPKAMEEQADLLQQQSENLRRQAQKLRQE